MCRRSTGVRTALVSPIVSSIADVHCTVYDLLQQLFDLSKQDKQVLSALHLSPNYIINHIIKVQNHCGEAG